MLMQLPQLRTVDVSGDRVVIHVDADGVDATRTVFLGLSEHPADIEPALFGLAVDLASCSNRFTAQKKVVSATSYSSTRTRKPGMFMERHNPDVHGTD